MPVKNDDNKKKNQLFPREKVFPPIWDDKYCDEFGELIESIYCPWVTVDNRYTAILGYAFDDFEDIERISIASTVEMIDERAFSLCSVLKEIRVDENNKKYKSIDGNLYSKDGKTLIKYASGKEERIFIVPNKVKHINNYAFEDADHLTSISIGDNVSSIGINAFDFCYNLISFLVSSNNQEYKSIDGVLYSKGGKMLIKYPSGKIINSFMIPESVTHINDCAFEGCFNLAEVFIGKNVSWISNEPFHGCYNLEMINVLLDNQEYKSINGILYSKDGKRLIKYPGSKLGNVFIIPNEVISIADSAFFDCENLRVIVINKKIISIGESAFPNASFERNSLTTIYYMGTENEWKKIAIAPSSHTIDRDIYYYSETEPMMNYEGTAYDGSYWHYDIDGVTPVIWAYKKD